MFNLSFFAERLQDLMLENEFTSATLADKLGVNVSTVNHYLSGKYTPHAELLIKIADCFNCPADFLLGDGDDFTPKKYKECLPFSEHFKNFLKDNKCSQYKLNKETKISESLITYWIRGKYTPSVDNLIKLAEYFHCSVDRILGRSN